MIVQKKHMKGTLVNYLHATANFFQEDKVTFDISLLKVQFRFSKKDKFPTWFDNYLVRKYEINREISEIFLAFSENPNFNNDSGARFE